MEAGDTAVCNCVRWLTKYSVVYPENNSYILKYWYYIHEYFNKTTR